MGGDVLKRRALLAGLVATIACTPVIADDFALPEAYALFLMGQAADGTVVFVDGNHTGGVTRSFGRALEFRVPPAGPPAFAFLSLDCDGYTSSTMSRIPLDSDLRPLPAEALEITLTPSDPAEVAVWDLGCSGTQPAGDALVDPAAAVDLARTRMQTETGVVR